MNQRLQNAIAELHQLLPTIHLHLPTSATLIKRQVNQITSTQRQLEQMSQLTQVTLKHTQNRSLRQRYTTLIEIIQQLSRDADNLRILAEEFLVDLEGATACLRSVNRHRDYWVKQIEQLE